MGGRGKDQEKKKKKENHIWVKSRVQRTHGIVSLSFQKHEREISTGFGVKLKHFLFDMMQMRTETTTISCPCVKQHWTSKNNLVMFSRKYLILETKPLPQCLCIKTNSLVIKTPFNTFSLPFPPIQWYNIINSIQFQSGSYFSK